MSIKDNIRTKIIDTKHNWFFREPISVITESSIFIVFTLLILLVTPYQFQNNALDIIFESVGIESFFMTFFLIIFILPIFLLFLGPYIDPLDEKYYEEWLFIRFGWDNKFKQKFIKINQNRYEKLFFPLYRFNQSFGIGTIGVFIGLLFWQLVYQDYVMAQKLSGSILILIVFILSSKFLGHVASFKHFNDINLKPSERSVKFTIIIAFGISILIACTAFPHMLEKLSKPITATEKNCNEL